MPRRKRKYVPLKIKLAAALLALGHIDYEESKAMTAGQVISRYEFDHWPVLHALGGKDVPWNLRPLLRAKHREKSGKDTTAVAKVRRIIRKGRPAPRKATSSFSRPPARTRWPKRKIASRPFPGAKSRSPGKCRHCGGNGIGCCWGSLRCWKATPPRDVNHE